MTTEAPPVAEASRSGRGQWLIRPLAIYAASRLVSLVAFILTVTVASVIGLDFSTGRPWPAPPAGQSPLLTALTGWDGSWYVQIARHGYGDQSGVMAFFPGYPMSIRLVAAVTGLSDSAAAVVAALAWGALAAVLLWALSSALGDRSFADRSTALFAFFPGSFVFTMAYSEPMMLAASIGCLLCLHQRRWVLAGLCGALATATRPNAARPRRLRGVGGRRGHPPGARLESPGRPLPDAGRCRRLFRLSVAAHRIAVGLVRRRAAPVEGVVLARLAPSPGPATPSMCCSAGAAAPTSIRCCRPWG